MARVDLHQRLGGASRVGAVDQTVVEAVELEYVAPAGGQGGGDVDVPQGVLSPADEQLTGRVRADRLDKSRLGQHRGQPDRRVGALCGQPGAVRAERLADHEHRAGDTGGRGRQLVADPRHLVVDGQRRVCGRVPPDVADPPAGRQQHVPRVGAARSGRRIATARKHDTGANRLAVGFPEICRDAWRKSAHALTPRK